MSSDTLLLAVVLGISPSVVLAAVLLLVADQGRPKAVALALGWSLAIAVVAALSLLAAHDIHFTRGSTHSKFLDVLDVVLGVALAGWALWMLRGMRRADASEPKWMRRLDSMPTFGAFVLGAFLPPYVVVVAGVSAIVRSERGTGARSLAALLFLLVGSIGAYTPVAIAFLARDPDRVLRAWRTWVIANWRRVLVVILLVGGVYLAVKGTLAWSHDATAAPTAAAAYRPWA